MGDTILFGVLRMPYKLAMSDEISRHQYWQRGQQAADEIERLREVLHDLLVRTPLWLEDTKINVEMAERYREARAKAYAALGEKE